MAVSKRKIIGYAVLPGIIPRFVALFRSGFAHIAYLLAVIFHGARLLPSGHPYIQPQNMGRFGIRHVMAQAYTNLEFRWARLDQILVFFAIAGGLVLLALQFFVLLAMLVSGQVMAQGTTSAFELMPWTDWFTLGSGSGISFGPEQDMALMTLDRIFGVKDIFESCISTGANCIDYRGETVKSPPYPYPFHIALHSMFQFYSFGIVFVAAIVLLYFTVTLVTETAETGVPFGQRYTKAWYPIRLIVFFALLTPLNIGGVNAGLNGGQIVTLWTAKFGSNLASNGWGFFGDVMQYEYMGDARKLIAKPGIPQLGSLAQFMFVAKTCAYGKLAGDGIDIRPYVVVPGGGSAMEVANTPFSDALVATKNGTVVVHIGESDISKHWTETSGVSKECGRIAFNVTDVKEPGSVAVQESYYTLMRQMWADTAMGNMAKCAAKRRLPEAPGICSEWPNPGLMSTITKTYNDSMEADIKEALEQQINNADFSVTDTMKKKGWAAAAVWYTRIAQMNGAVTTSIFNVPRPDKWPRVLEVTLEQRLASNASVGSEDLFSPFLNGGVPVKHTGNKDKQLAELLNAAYISWGEGVESTGSMPKSNNAFLDTINLVFGTAGLFDIRNNTDVHPMAQISSLGRSLVEATLRNALTSFGLRFGRAALDIFGKTSPLGPAADAATGFFFSIAMMTLSIGTILYYVVPFLPFIYFFFGVSMWLKSIFEAMVAMPLWALAHIIRIDGEGLPGNTAANGYILLFEILLRPILMVVGLLAAMSTFAAFAIGLNQIFDLLIENTGGFNISDDAGLTDMEFYRGALDQLMFTIIYAALIYMMGLSSFKLIDAIPNQILRWFGSSTQTFQESSPMDAAGQLSGSVYKSTTILSGQVEGGRLAVLLNT